MTANKFFKCKGKSTTEYERLYSFKSAKTKKNYMIYTDNRLDLKGNIRVLFGIYNPDDDEYEMLPIETEEDWQIVEQEWKKQVYGDSN